MINQLINKGGMYVGMYVMRACKRVSRLQMRSMPCHAHLSKAKDKRDVRNFQRMLPIYSSPASQPHGVIYFFEAKQASSPDEY